MAQEVLNILFQWFSLEINLNCININFTFVVTQNK